MTPPARHTGIALDAMRLGCHVLVEKPLATTVEECDQLAAESAARGLQICVNHSMLGDPIFRQTVKAIRNGAVGDVLTADIFRSSIFPRIMGGLYRPSMWMADIPFETSEFTPYICYGSSWDRLRISRANSGSPGNDLSIQMSISMNGVFSCVVHVEAGTSPYPGMFVRCNIF